MAQVLMCQNLANAKMAVPRLERGVLLTGSEASPRR